MMLFSIGFAQKPAERFFTLLSDNHIELLIDIRLNNKSQLAGFTKGDDLRYFLGKICGCAYKHCNEFAPTSEILSAYRKKEIEWEEYEKLYIALMNERGDYFSFCKNYSQYQKIAMLCSEPTANMCHRRLLSDLIQETSSDIQIKHL